MFSVRLVHSHELSVRNYIIIIDILPASTVTQHNNKGRQNTGTGHF